MYNTYDTKYNRKHNTEFNKIQNTVHTRHCIQYNKHNILECIPYTTKYTTIHTIQHNAYNTYITVNTVA